jgi:hypothetical protein
MTTSFYQRARWPADKRSDPLESGKHASLRTWDAREAVRRLPAEPRDSSYQISISRAPGGSGALHRQILKPDAGAVEQRDLVVAAPASMGAVDHRADGRDVALFGSDPWRSRAGIRRCETDCATSSVNTWRRPPARPRPPACPWCRCPCRQMRAGLDPGSPSAIGAKLEVMVMMTSASAPSSSRLTASNGRPSSSATSASLAASPGAGSSRRPFRRRALGRRAQLELRLVAGADHAEHLRVLARQMLDRHRRGRRGAQRGQVDCRRPWPSPAGVGVEQEHRRLVVGQALVHVAGPVAAGFEPSARPARSKPDLKP